MNLTWQKNVYVQERNLMEIIGFNASAVKAKLVSTPTGGSAITAWYTIPASRELTIDLSDIVRLASGGRLTITEHDSSGTQLSTYTTIWSVVGRINLLYAVIPPIRTINERNGTLFVVPPSKMIEPTHYSTTLKLGFKATPLSGVQYLYKIGSTETAAVDGFSVGGAIKKITLIRKQSITNYTLRNYNIEPMKCGVLYASARWVSCTGETREHTFEALKQKISKNNPYSLLNLQNEYTEITGREESFVLHLDGLCAYDIWYYADMLTSSKVEVSFGGGSGWRRVKLVTDNIVIPDNEVGDGVFDAEFKFVKYDAVAV